MCVPSVPVCRLYRSNWLEIWSHEELVERQREDAVVGTVHVVHYGKVVVSKYSAPVRTLLLQ